MGEFGASSLTVQRAMALLKHDGWAVSRPGKGAFVAQHDHREDPYAETAPPSGTATRVEALEQALADAVPQLADLRARVDALEAGNGEPDR
jgi:DNA-binding GntR family transcriptional regulator